MSRYTRRHFLQTSASLMATGIVSTSFGIKKAKPLLSFSTLACPDWNFQQICDFAIKHGYKGIEMRGLLREIDLTKCNEFNTPESRNATLALMKKNGLQFVNLGSSASMHLANEAERKKSLDGAKQFIDLAQQLNCPYIRVYPNNFPKDQEREATLQLMINGLKELGDYAKDKNVKVLMETHGELLHSDDLENVMQSVSHPHVGLVWDICNMWTVTKEQPSYMYKKLKSYIHHTHIKDAKLVDGKPLYTFLGRGEVPIFEAIGILQKDGYTGYYSFEWEKLWHPELAEPELALADYPVAMKKQFKFF